MNMNNKRDFWQQQMLGWSKSGLSQKTYCSQEGLTLSTFSYWRKRLKSSKGPCGKLIQVPLSSYGVSVRIAASGLQMDVPIDALEQVLPVILRSLQGAGLC